MRYERCSGVGSREPGSARLLSGRGSTAKTARRYVAAAQAEGLVRKSGLEALSDELIGAVVAVVAAIRPVRPNGHGSSWELLLAQEEQIRKWVAGG